MNAFGSIPRRLRRRPAFEERPLGAMLFRYVTKSIAPKGRSYRCNQLRDGHGECVDRHACAGRTAAEGGHRRRRRACAERGSRRAATPPRRCCRTSPTSPICSARKRPSSADGRGSTPATVRSIPMCASTGGWPRATASPQAPCSPRWQGACAHWSAPSAHRSISCRRSAAPRRPSPPMSTPCAAQARRSSTRARRFPACAWRRNTRCASAAASITASGCSTR